MTEVLVVRVRVVVAEMVVVTSIVVDMSAGMKVDVLVVVVKTVVLMIAGVIVEIDVLPGIITVLVLRTFMVVTPRYY